MGSAFHVGRGRQRPSGLRRDRARAIPVIRGVGSAGSLWALRWRRQGPRSPEERSGEVPAAPSREFVSCSTRPTLYVLLFHDSFFNRCFPQTIHEMHYVFIIKPSLMKLHHRPGPG